jgi:multiple sugar transport system substrate-binding protein
VLGIAGLAPLAAACGAAEQGGQSPVGAAPRLAAGATVAFWNDIAGQYVGLMQRWADTFQQRTGVRVEVTGAVGDYEAKLTAGYAAGTPPDIYRYRPNAVPVSAAAQQNRLLALDAFVKRDRYDLADFRKEAVELYRWRGALYALPRDYGLQLVYYHTELFAQAGLPPIPTDWNDRTWTFQKFLEVCQRLTRGGERYALFVPRGLRLWASFVYSNGGALVKRDRDGVATEVALAEKPAVDALQLMQDLMYKHRVAPEPAEERTLGNQLALMQAGRLAMQITNPGGNAQYMTTGMPYDVGVFPLGAAPRRGVGGGGTGWGIARPTRVPEETWAFLAYIASREGELGEVAIGQTTPSRTSVVTGKEYLDPTAPPKGKRVFADGQEYVVRDPEHPRWPDAERDVLAKLLDTRFWTGQETAAQVAKQIKEQGDVLLKS